MTDIITASDKLSCVQRELKMRRQLYPRWVEEGKMSEGAAAHQLACMEDIVRDYRAAAEKERLL